MDMVTTWAGVPVKDLSHEELLSAFEELGRLYLQEQEDNRRRWDMAVMLRGVEKQGRRGLFDNPVLNLTVFGGR